MKKFFKEKNQDIPSILYSEESPENFILITDVEEIKNLYVTLYFNREIDGKDYFNKIRAELVYSYESGEITIQDIFNIENILSPVISKLIIGDWMSAQNQLSNIVASGSLSQSIYDEIMVYFTTYLSDNY